MQSIECFIDKVTIALFQKICFNFIENFRLLIKFQRKFYSIFFNYCNKINVFPQFKKLFHDLSPKFYCVFFIIFKIIYDNVI